MDDKSLKLAQSSKLSNNLQGIVAVHQVLNKKTNLNVNNLQQRQQQINFVNNNQNSIKISMPVKLISQTIKQTVCLRNKKSHKFSCILALATKTATARAQVLRQTKCQFKHKLAANNAPPSKTLGVATLSLMSLMLLVLASNLFIVKLTTFNGVTAATSSQQAANQNQLSAKGCPYPSVNANCQVSIGARAPPVALLNTEFVADEYATLKHETQATYKCDFGYSLIGHETVTCLQNNRWSGSAPVCVTNIAAGKPANQSSTVKAGDARNAVDKQQKHVQSTTATTATTTTTQISLDSSSSTTSNSNKLCTETKVEQSPWWQIDLLQAYDVRTVRITSRAPISTQNSGSTSQFTLHDLEIRVGNSSSLQGNRLCAWHPENVDDGTTKDFQCAHPIVGRFVSIQMVGIEASLSLCEVSILSTSEFPTERCDVSGTLGPSSSSKLASSSISKDGLNDNNIIVFNRACYEIQATSGGSFLVADAYCKARHGALFHSISNLSHTFISSELERMKTKLKSKLIWIGAKRENSMPYNGDTILTAGSTSALFEGIHHDAIHLSPSRGQIASLTMDTSATRYRSPKLSIFDSAENSPLDHSPLTVPLYQTSSGTASSYSRGSQILGLSSFNNHNTSHRSVEHPHRSLIVSQPSQLASSFFAPPQISSSTVQHAPSPLQSTSTSAALSSTNSAFTNPSNFHIQRIKPPSLIASSIQTQHSVTSPHSSSSWQSPALSTSNVNTNHHQPSKWRWVIEDNNSSSDISNGLVQNFFWADDQPNNYNNQQDCIVMDGSKRWQWNDVTCELDYLPWVCQYKSISCGSPDRHENSTILELFGPSQESTSDNQMLFKYGKTITYACPVGHKMVEGTSKRKCQADGTWSDKAPKCQYVNCGELSQLSIENGRLIYLNTSATTYGSTVKYICNDDYVLVGPDVRHCGSDSKWSGKQPYCAYKWCPALASIANGNLNVSSYHENSLAIYSCNPGYKLIGNDTRQCLLGGKWTNQEPFCQYVDCGQPRQIPHGSYELVNKTTNYLSLVQYSCNDNYTLVDSSANKLLCQHTNRWVGREPECSLINCGSPQAIAGSSFKGTSFSVHSTVAYKCDAGFKEVGGNPNRVCGLDGQWSGQPLACKYVDCGRVPAILKGDVSYINGTTHVASQVVYECTPGSRLSGAKVRYCQPDGRWSGSSPKCEEVRCAAPELPPNGSAIYIGNDRSFKEQSFSVGVTVQYECDYGHVVKGSWSSRLCQANGEWSGEPPTCKYVECGKPPNIENGQYILKHRPATQSSGTEIMRRTSTGNEASSTSVGTNYGTIAQYSCDAGFKLMGSSQHECLEDGTWREPLPTCEPIRCPKFEFLDEFTTISYIPKSFDSSNPDAPMTANQRQSAINLVTNGQITSAGTNAALFGLGDKLLYSCAAGYELYGGPEIRSCTQYGQWSGSSVPRCRLIDCELKVRTQGNLIETLNVAQSGVSTLLTALPIGMKVCANNGQWMPNDQQPKCVNAADAVLFEGSDNTLDLRGSSLSHSSIFGNDQLSPKINDGLNDGHHSGFSTTNVSSGSALLWPKLVFAACSLVMLSLIGLTLFCIRSGKKLDNNSNNDSRARQASNHLQAMQFHLSKYMIPQQATSNQQQPLPPPPPLPPSLNANQHTAIMQQQRIGSQAMFVNSTSAHHQFSHALHARHAYGDSEMLAAQSGAGEQMSMFAVNNNTRPISSSGSGEISARFAKARTLSGGESPDAYLRLQLESPELVTNKMIRHNPNGLVTFVSPAVQQQQLQQQQAQRQHVQNQNSPQLSTQSSASSPSSTDSTHGHTTATRLSSTTDSGSASSYAPGPPPPSVPPPGMPPSLPSQPPPAHRAYMHQQQMSAFQNQQRYNLSNQQHAHQSSASTISSNSATSAGNNQSTDSSHYMETATRIS